MRIDQTFALADYEAALARLEAGEQLGKIVLTDTHSDRSVRWVRTDRCIAASPRDAMPCSRRIGRS